MPKHAGTDQFPFLKKMFYSATFISVYNKAVELKRTKWPQKLNCNNYSCQCRAAKEGGTKGQEAEGGCFCFGVKDTAGVL